MIRTTLTFALALLALPVHAQDEGRRLSHCIAIADATPGVEFIQKASFRDPVPDFSARISYLSHSMFLIQTPGGSRRSPTTTAGTATSISSPTW